MYNNTVRINDTDSVGYGLFNVADSFIRYEGDIAKAKLSILYLICRLLISVYNLLPPPDNIRVIVIVFRLRGNIIRTALCWIV